MLTNYQQPSNTQKQMSVIQCICSQKLPKHCQKTECNLYKKKQGSSIDRLRKNWNSWICRYKFLLTLYLSGHL